MCENFEQSKMEEHEGKESEKKDFFNTTKSQIIDIYPFKEGEKEEVEKMFSDLEQQLEGLGDESLVNELKKIVLYLDNSHTLLERKISGSKFVAENRIKKVEGRYWLKQDVGWLEVKKIDNREIDESIQELVRVTPGGTDEYKKEMALIRVMESAEAKSINLSLEDSDELQEMELEFNELKEPDLDKIISSQIVDNIGILKINSWNNQVKHENKSIDELVEDELIKLESADSMIIDVRGNGGGDSSIAMKLAGRFIGDEKGYSTCQERLLGQDEYRGHINKVEPVKPYIDKPVVVLTSPKCLSSNEMFIASLKDTGRAITIGETTGGGSGKPQSTELKLGVEDYILKVSSWRQYRNNGQEFENRGIEPDIEAHQTIEDLHNDKDTVLETAIEYLSKEK